ncbi:MAG: DNA integrity scanning protein DisA nucleotide-binding domain protein [Isosphaeraceae bacterium]|nr:DNA integrity scanning protein DisA nucleotide-binding domain protein [Isosphaeraceae bacterium]
MGVTDTLSWREAADILVISYLVHRLFLLFRRTTALQVLVTLICLRLLLTLARAGGLVMTGWFFEGVNLWAPLVILVLFRNEIREALVQSNPLRLLVGRPDQTRGGEPAAIAEAVFRLAQAKIGALLVFPNRDRLGEYVREGLVLNGRFSAAVLESLFGKESPVHDGAVVIRGGRIERVGTFLPLSTRPGLPPEFGTRHRAAIGLSEVCDAVVVVVSEERGEVAVVQEGSWTLVEHPGDLERELRRRLPREFAAAAVRHRVHDWASRMLGFALTFLLVWITAAWGLYGDGQTSRKSFGIPIDFRNLPPDLDLSSTTATTAQVQIEGQGPLIGTLTAGQIAVSVDLHDARPGTRVIQLGAGNVELPPGLRMARITPPRLQIVLESRIEKRLPIRPVLTGSPPEGYRVEAISRPASVLVHGPESDLRGLDYLETQPIDLGSLRPEDSPKIIAMNVVLTPPSLRLINPADEVVQVEIRFRPESKSPGR